MAIEKVPFVNYTLEEDKDQSKWNGFTVRVNQEDEAMIRELKEWFDTDQDSTALKMAARIGYNVTQNTFGTPLLKRLFKKDRSRKG